MHREFHAWVICLNMNIWCMLHSRSNEMCRWHCIYNHLHIQLILYMFVHIESYTHTHIHIYRVYNIYTRNMYIYIYTYSYIRMHTFNIYIRNHSYTYLYLHIHISTSPWPVSALWHLQRFSARGDASKTWRTMLRSCEVWIFPRHPVPREVSTRWLLPRKTIHYKWSWHVARL